MGSGGGSQSTTTVDPVFNAGMLKLSQEQQGWAAEMFNMFKYGVSYNPNEAVSGYYDASGKFVQGAAPAQQQGQAYGGKTPSRGYGATQETGAEEGEGNLNRQRFGWQKAFPPQMGPIQQGPSREYTTITRGELEGYDPNAQTSEMEYLQNLVDANQELLGLKTDVGKEQLGLTREQIGAQRELLPLETDLKTIQIGAQKEILPLATGLAKEQIGAKRELLPLQTGVSKKRLGLASTFLEDVNKGIDVDSRMNEAQAGVQHGFKNARRAADVNLFSYGLDPSSGRFASSNRDLQLAEAGGIAGARTGAKNLADHEDFERKKAGLQLTY